MVGMKFRPTFPDLKTQRLVTGLEFDFVAREVGSEKDFIWKPGFGI
jgi:hypothetical protein